MGESDLIQSQNDLLDKEILRTREQYSTDDQKVRFETENIMRLNYLNWYLFYLYYIVIIATSFFIANSKYTNRTKITIILLFLIYPFTISLVQHYIYDLSKYVYATIFGLPYKKSY